MITVCALLLTIAGAVALYLSSGQQQILQAPAPRGTRPSGAMLALLGLLFWWRDAGAGAGIAATVTTLMFAWVALPYVSWRLSADRMKKTDPA